MYMNTYTDRCAYTSTVECLSHTNMHGGHEYTAVTPVFITRSSVHLTAEDGGLKGPILRLRLLKHTLEVFMRLAPMRVNEWSNIHSLYRFGVFRIRHH